jgi:hypothetical protein
VETVLIDLQIVTQRQMLSSVSYKAWPLCKSCKSSKLKLLVIFLYMKSVLFHLCLHPIGGHRRVLHSVADWALFGQALMLMPQLQKIKLTSSLKREVPKIFNSDKRSANQRQQVRGDSWGPYFSQSVGKITDVRFDYILLFMRHWSHGIMNRPPFKSHSQAGRSWKNEERTLAAAEWDRF